MDKRRITSISSPGGSGRVPTGAIQFQEDWPGLFVRGDEAIGLMASIRILVERVGQHEDPVVRTMLASLSELADLIERDVVSD